MRSLFILALVAVALSACARPSIVQERVSRVSVPVTVPCVSGDRPAPVAPLSVQILAQEWRAMTPKQKAAAVGAQALRHQSRAEALDAATGACQ